MVAGEEGICKGCGVATLSISYYDLGYTTGEMAAKILADGADVSTMPVEYCAQRSPRSTTPPTARRWASPSRTTTRPSRLNNVEHMHD